MGAPARTRNEATLIAVADAATVRLFLRHRAETPLEELLLPALATDAIAKTAPSAEASGDNEEIFGGTPAHAFLLAVAASIGQTARQVHAARLVICAPPHTLCALRDGLDAVTRRLLVRELTRNVVNEPLAAIDAWLDQQLI